jgi:hypothetical protein
MKYDSKKCNNLNFKLKDGTLGFIKVAPSGFVYLYYDMEACKKDWDVDAMMPKDFFMTNFSHEESFNLFIKEKGLEIVPRDPGTYVVWKVGDRVVDKETGCLYTIAAKLGDIVFLLRDNNAVTSTCTAMLVKYYALVLTDYEKELIHAQEPKKKKYGPFKNGDSVLVRDNNNEPWQHDIFYFYEEESSHPYCCEIGQYQQCIPYNEHTWQLLNTTDEYKEE